jgi:hypothetical protein
MINFIQSRRLKIWSSQPISSVMPMGVHLGTPMCTWPVARGFESENFITVVLLQQVDRRQPKSLRQQQVVAPCCQQAAECMEPLLARCECLAGCNCHRVWLGLAWLGARLGSAQLGSAYPLHFCFGEGLLQNSTSGDSRCVLA